MEFPGFAVVRAVKHKSTGEEFACKIIKLPGPNDPIGPDDVPRYTHALPSLVNQIPVT